MIRLGISAIGLAATGMDDWASASAILRRQISYQADMELNLKKLELLPANERRRTTQLIKLALQSAQDVHNNYQFDHAKLATVFSCSDGDLDVVDKIISSLCMEGSPVSPIHFHNSVHNAPSGYWSIATKSRLPSTSLSAYDDSFSVGLLEAATQIISADDDVLLVSYESSPPTTLKSFRHIEHAFSSALYLRRADKSQLHSILEIEVVEGNNEFTQMSDPQLEMLRLDNPAARALPLLECLANKAPTTITIPYLSDAALQIKVIPC